MPSAEMAPQRLEKVSAPVQVSASIQNKRTIPPQKTPPFRKRNSQIFALTAAPQLSLPALWLWQSETGFSKAKLLLLLRQSWWGVMLGASWSLIIFLGLLRLRERRKTKREFALSHRVTERIQQLNEEIYEGRLIEQHLRANQQFLQNVLDKVPSMIFVKTPNGKYTMVNQAFAAFCGTTVQSLCGKTSADLSTDKNIIPDLTTYPHSIFRARQEYQNYEHEFTHANGNTYWLQTSTRPIIGADGAELCTLGIATDITAQKLLEGQLREREKQEIIGQLAAGIAQEINAPTQFLCDNTRFVRDAFLDISALLDKFTELLTAVKTGNAQPALISEVEAKIEMADIHYLAAEIPHALSQSLDGVSHIAQIAQSMKELATPDAPEKFCTNINKAIENTVTIASNEWKYFADVELQLADNLPLVPCYVSDLNQVLLHLIMNATHAVAAGVGDGSNGKGKITLTTKLVNHDWVEIRIADTGTGIMPASPPSNHDSSLSQATESKTSQGVSLAYYVIIERHKGQIEVDAEFGRGTTFIIRLPIKS